ncbi:hypothetical protein PI23P_09510 [Polaribacter irgensii 23-P]|uniref:DUF2834 domain-containing protein n=1 Tax=Polaribacter irgensii 23-P TaxID=313594 RepID=A4C0B1_9FLAO|nr:DUF2834 domain-containing protein [Polaribacter irgensii]EAR12854.1 hypothetical protein PI23P_09510 [Polaribacter irgensii 23-P]
MKRKHLFLVLTVIGITYTWYFNIQYFQTVENPSMTSFLNDAQVNFAGKSFGADLTVVVFTFFAFMIPESLRLKIKYWWVLIPLTFLVAVAFTFPLFLYLRENSIERLKKST